MKNITNVLFGVAVLTLLPACCGCKKKNTKATQKDAEVTLNNTVDTLSIELVQEKPEENSKF